MAMFHQPPTNPRKTNRSLSLGVEMQRDAVAGSQLPFQKN
jgi:hypothetical protein